MPKNCNAEIGKEQKLLLKVLNCLWVQYVSNRTGATKAYFKSPSQQGYDKMSNELSAIVNLLNNNNAVRTLDTTGGQVANAVILSAYANGAVAYDSAFDSEFNDYAKSGNIDRYNIGTQKPIQMLNLDECLSQSFQVRPYNNVPNSGDLNDDQLIIQPNWVTQAVVFERTGCAGVSNTGFVGLALEVDITAFPFNVCDNLSVNCAKLCDKKNKH